MSDLSTSPAATVAAPPQVTVVTGMSGAGRTEAAKVLEDLGFFVIDNLPPTLLGKVVELATQPGSPLESLALVADVRGGGFFDALVDAVDDLRRRHFDVRVVFLEADDDTLVRRFETSRRRHPLSGDGGVHEGIVREREQLDELRGLADLLIDTTDLNVHTLRERLVDAFGDRRSRAMQITVTSFGFKYGLPRDSDLVMDVRFLPNPHWVDELRPFTGTDERVRSYVLGQPQAEAFLAAFLALLDVVVPGYVQEGKRYLSIAVGCTGGKHRSVTIAEEIARHLHATCDLPVHVEHRDVGRE